MIVKPNDQNIEGVWAPPSDPPPCSRQCVSLPLEMWRFFKHPALFSKPGLLPWKRAMLSSDSYARWKMLWRGILKNRPLCQSLATYKQRVADRIWSAGVWISVPKLSPAPNLTSVASVSNTSYLLQCIPFQCQMYKLYYLSILWHFLDISKHRCRVIFKTVVYPYSAQIND